VNIKFIKYSVPRFDKNIKCLLPVILIKHLVTPIYLQALILDKSKLIPAHIQS